MTETEIKRWVLALLFTSVCGMIYHFLLPSGSVSKTAKKIISLVMLCAVCMPVFGVFRAGTLFPSIPEIFGEAEEAETSVPYAYYENAARYAIEEQCRETVGKYTSVPFEVTADVHISADGGIRIEHIRIVFDAQPEGKDGMTAELTALLGMVPDIRVDGSDE